MNDRPRCRSRRLLAGLAVATAALVAPAAPAGSLPGPAAVPASAPGAEPRDPDTNRPVIDDRIPSISPELAGVEVDSTGFRAARSRLHATQADLDAARQARATAEQRLVELQAADAALTAEIAAQTARKKVAGTELAQVRDNLRAIAVASYVGGREYDTLTVMLDPTEGTDLQGQQVIRTTVNQDQRARRIAVEAEFDSAVAALNAAVRERIRVRDETAATIASRDQATADEARFAEALASRQADLERARALAMVKGADFPLVALDAYHRAARTLAVDLPSCGLPWWALAGITKVESGHGTAQGSVLLSDGDTSGRIIGIPLDGTNGTALIGDTERGAMDADPVYDRAVGPMQFIPSTWAPWGRDGNGDGLVNPHNLYDTALTAGHYLCASGPLTDDAGLLRAFFSYNHSDAYAASVLSWAHGYRAVLIPRV